jgi:hypothetical protein
MEPSRKSIPLPVISLSQGPTIRVGHHGVSIHPRSRQAKLLQYFQMDASRYLPRQKLLDVVGHAGADSEISVVREEALMKSGVKVLSRLRQRLMVSFQNMVPDGTEWLPYSSKVDGWILFKLPGYGSDGQWH